MVVSDRLWTKKKITIKKAMDLRDIKETQTSRKKPMRVGRGSGSGKGKTSGKGMKGQNSRSGVTTPRVFEGGTMPLYRRLPKRGFNNVRFQDNWVAINVSQLNKLKPGTEVTLELLQQESILKINNGKKVYWKLLGNGKLEVENLAVKVHKISKQAKEKLEQAKGKLEILPIKTEQIKSRRKKL